MNILDGKKLAQKLKDSLKQEVTQLKEQTGKVPCLVNVIVGSDAGSCAYANAQMKTAAYMGIDYELRTLPEDISQEKFSQEIADLNRDSTVNGIMIHKPLPKQIKYGEVADYVDVAKDLEGINVANIGRMILGETKIIPCTPASVMEHLKSTGIQLEGKEVVIVGHSTIVGKPLSLLLLRELATVTVCHIGTSRAGKLIEHIQRADVVVVAVGSAGLIRGEWIKEKAIVIDVGINRVEDRIVGDVDFEGASKKASFITPVPGGVGPVTVVVLMRNGIEAFKMQNNL
ncbi:Methenyltetrahydrofolate cyclohydrolase / Methylenetetrahydrofolate dehydrogenase (NADP+) [hydrothermal vent metagenome]|uniref:methenyltetrahydrofolate cyclohydrolase n=1 Tax=hydrothermal vent metagenome TaxID=652676 RepID=A0A3B1D9D5_9ZZZZ